MTDEPMYTAESLSDISAFSDGKLDPAFMDTPFSQIQALSIIQSPTDPSLIKTRKSGKTDLSYVSGDIVTRILNKAFRYKWSFYILETRVVESQDKSNKYKPEEQPVPQLPVIQVHGRLVVPGWGIREQWGAQPLSGGSDVQEHAFKSAATDAMKKCASMFGIALDLYGKDGMNELAVNTYDFIPDDDVIIENFKNKMKRDYEAKKPAPQTTQPVSPVQDQAEPVGPEAPAQPQAPIQEPVVPVSQELTPKTVQEVQQSVPVDTQPVQPTTQPVQPTTSPAQAPVASDSEWQTEDIVRLREAKTKLGIADSNNEGLNPYAQEFFNMEEASYLNIRPNNVKDFLHFLSSKFQ